MEFTLLASVFSIVVIDLVLSGDNALVIGMAAHRLPPRQRRWAIIMGGAGAIGLRILFTALAVFLLTVPLLQAAGGLMLTWIAYKLLRDETQAGHHVEAQDTLIDSVQTIIVADAAMSLDNILAVGGAAHGSVELLLFGLALSMPLLLFGSSLIARLMNRVPWLIVVGTLVLTVTAARMIADDRWIAGAVPASLHLPLLIGLALLLSAVAAGPAFIGWRRAARGVSANAEVDGTLVSGSRHGESHGDG
ncbi:MAG: TerC family protein [Sphaerobacter sp.]|nr:TerC family protein [Sphaerobacter sp.]